MKLIAMCNKCHKTKTLRVTNEGFNRWREDGEQIKDVLPELSAEDRSLLTSGVCWLCAKLIKQEKRNKTANKIIHRTSR